MTLLALTGVLLLVGCSGSGYSTVHYGVYSGYGYPFYDDDIDHYHYYNRPNHPNKPGRPGAGTSIQPRPGTSFQTRPGTSFTRPGLSGGGMGRPARMSRGGGGRRR